MRLRYGKVISKQREETLRRYTSSRLHLIELSTRLPNKDYFAAREWVFAYERFMCRGFTRQEAVSEPDDPGVPQAQGGVDRACDPGHVGQ